MTSSLDTEARALLTDGLARLGARHGVSVPAAQRNTAALWNAFRELGLPDLTIPQERGGFGASMADINLVMRAIGRDLLDAPFLSTSVLAMPLIALADADHRGSLENRIRGGTVAAFAHAEPKMGYASGAVAAIARPSDNGYRVTGEKMAVIDAGRAELAIVTACDAEGRNGLFLIESDAPGLTIRSTRAVDGRSIGSIVLEEAPAERIGPVDARDPIARTLDRGLVASCAEAVGAMHAVLSATRDYLKTRRAFGRTLSQFQVLQHRYVDMYVALEESEAILTSAEAAIDEDDPEDEAVVAACKVAVGRNARFIGEQGIHLHGGIGMTDELSLSHYYKRLMVIEARLGSSEYHLDRYVALRDSMDAAA